MKQRALRKSILLLAITSIMLFAMSITASADEDVDMKIVQEENTWYGTSYDERGDNVKITWSYLINDGEHYHIEYSLDGINWATDGDTKDSEYTIDGLKAGSEYYVRLKVYKGSHLFDSKSETSTNYVAVSKAVQVKTACVAPESTAVQQTAATLNTVSLKWGKVDGAESYNVYIYQNGKYNILASDITKTTAKISKLEPSEKYDLYIAAVRTGAGGYKMVGEKTKVTVKTKSDKVSGLQITYTWTSLSECKYEWTRENESDGYQILITSLDGKKTYCKKNVTDDYADIKGCSFGKMSKARVRSYILLNGKKVYGPWSNDCYNGVTKNVTVKRSKSGKQIGLSWKKVTGASKYIVYISTKENSGYKKAATLSSKKTKYTIKKYNGKALKKNKKYYVKIVSVYKKGGKTYKSSGSSVQTVDKVS